MNIFALKNVNLPEYHVSLTPNKRYNFEEQLDNLVVQYEQIMVKLQLKGSHLVFAKIFLCDYINQKPLMEKHLEFSSIIEKSITSIIEQSPLDGAKINMLLYFIKSNDISIAKHDDFSSIQIGDKIHIYQSITNYTNECDTPYKQTKDAFDKHIKLLAKNDMSLTENCVRTWIYSRDVDKDYAGIVKARNDVFDKQGLTVDTHFITSTGIEGKGLHPHSSVNIDFYSIKGISGEQIQYLQALDYLNNTYEYGVAFERGIAITYPDKKHISISGTASIDKVGDCIFRDDVLKQVERIFVNIKMLLKDTNADLSDIAQMIVYLRNVSDYDIIRNYLDTNYTNIPRVIVLARVCRPEWLIEIECIAAKSIIS